VSDARAVATEPARSLLTTHLLPETEDLGRRELLRVLNRNSEVSGSIVDEIVVQVGLDIIQGRSLPGDDLNSVELARSFGSSRTPVREALLTLEREGFVEISARKRPKVAAMRAGDIRDMYRVRAHLYQMVSKEVVAKADAADLRRLHLLQDELALAVQEEDVDRYFWTNVEFRNAEAAITGNRTLCRLLDSLGLRMLRLRHISLAQPGRIGASLEDHERLLRAYEDRDEALACALTASLVLRGLATIERTGLFQEDD
jgi:DNA-binding GntR family transcriptional regulator